VRIVSMKMIVGLGNPGNKYRYTRHNVGFLAVEQLAQNLNVTITTDKFKAKFGQYGSGDQMVLLVLPQTYMNASGEAVIPLMNYYKISSEDLLVIYDDLDMPCGKLRLREQGSHGGHNGMRSIIQQLGHSKFKRIRIGIDKHPLIATPDYVLGKPTAEQEVSLSKAIVTAAKAAQMFLDNDFAKVMNEYNTNDKSLKTTE
jgi:peptidyl-tRNA hydrolase, PTH1 family